MFGISLVPEKTSIRFTKYARPCVAGSLAAMAAAVLLVLIVGLNLGIDFRGGTLIEIKTPSEEADLGQIRDTLGGLDLGDVSVQGFGAPDDVLIRIAQQPGGDSAQQEAQALVKTALGEALGAEVEYRRVEVVGPTVSGELIEAGTIAVVLAVIAMLIYVWFRFERQFAVGAVLALIHDVVLTIGVFALTQIEFNLSTIAAILTIVGYSMNDTVVVYDRIRENLRKYKKMALDELIDLSINETLSRTVVTSGTTLLALFSLYIFGGEVIRGFVFAMIFGVIIGTYSSIFIASPVLLWLGVSRDWSGAGPTRAAGGLAAKS